jgi:hypothetical protein
MPKSKEPKRKTQKKKSTLLPSKTPAPLTELCHDALATGVLELHGGLPPTWLKMFKKHRVAWRQLQKAVRESMGRQEEWLTEESTVMILYYDRDPEHFPQQYRAFPVPAKALPRWLYELLAAYFKAMYFKPYYSVHPDLEKCGMGGYQVDMTLNGKACRMYDRILSILDDDLHDELVERLFEALDVDVDRIYDHLIYETVVDEQGEENTALKEEYEGMDHKALFSEFPDETRKAVHEALDDAQEWNLDVQWVDSLYDEHAERNAKRNLIRAPFATLYFAFSGY